jgi:HK97 family phage major capsid protein
MSKVYAELLDRQRLLHLEEQGIVAAVDRQKGNMSPEQRTRLDAIDAEWDITKPGSLAGKIALEVERRERDRNGPAAGEQSAVGAARVAGLNGEPESRLSQGRIGVRKYADIFGGNLSDDGFPSMEAYLRTIHTGMADPRLQAAVGTMTENVGADGGWMVPTEYAAELLDGAIEDSIVMPRARVYEMKSQTKRISGFSASDHTGGSIYGFQALWMVEDAIATPQKGTVVPIVLTANKMALFAGVSNELVADGTSFEEQLGEALTASMRFGLDYAFLQGTGAGKPRGVLNDPALITVTKEINQVNATIMYDNLVKMLARLHPALLAGSVWIANTTLLPQLATLTVPIGTAGQLIPVMTESDGSFKILTRPVIWTEKLPALGAKGDIILANLGEYAVGLRKEMSLDKSNAVGWYLDEMAYRMIVRVTGQGRWTGPITPLNGDTLSWCVALAPR